MRGLQYLVRKFRAGMLDGDSPQQMCYAVSLPLASYLELCGFPCRLTHGYLDIYDEPGHTWITLHDGRIVDATASQFPAPGGEQMPDVYIGPLPAWYHETEVPPT